MAHGISRRKLGRAPDQRMAILRNLITSLIWHGKVVTTEPRAKEAQSMAERLINLARVDTVANRRQAARVLYPVGYTRKYTVTNADGTTKTMTRPATGKPGSVETAVARLFKEVGPQYQDRPGGFTRLLRLGAIPPKEGSDRANLGARRGDGATMAKLELVDYLPPKAI